MARASMNDGEFFAFALQVIDGGRLRLEAQFSQHGTTSTLLHSIAVAYHAERMARRMGRLDHIDEVRRAGLLHDYYLYDWHEHSERSAGHATKHAGRALANALADYPDLTPLEQDAIRCHMFPVNPTPPSSEVGWLITCSDKRCAWHETLVRSGLAHPLVRGLCAQYLPDVELGVTASPAEVLLAARLARREAC